MVKGCINNPPPKPSHSSKENVMPIIYIDPLNLGTPVRIDTEDFSQCEPWKHNPRYNELGCEAARLENTGKKRPEHSKLMKDKYKNDELFMPRGQAKGKRTGQALENIRNGVRMRKKQVSCIKCHKPTDRSMFEGAWMCHFNNHHKSC